MTPKENVKTEQREAKNGTMVEVLFQQLLLQNLTSFSAQGS